MQNIEQHQPRTQIPDENFSRDFFPPNSFLTTQDLPPKSAPKIPIHKEILTPMPPASILKSPAVYPQTRGKDRLAEAQEIISKQIKDKPSPILQTKTMKPFEKVPERAPDLPDVKALLDKYSIEKTPKPVLRDPSFLKQNEIIKYDDFFLTGDIYFLLAEEENNLASYREIIEKEKARVDNDVELSLQQLSNIFIESKIRIHEAIDSHYKNYIDQQKKFKDKVIEFKSQKQKMPEITNQRRNLGIGSNTQLINELEEIRSHAQYSKAMQQMTIETKEIQNEILEYSKNLLSIMSALQKYYFSEKFVEYVKSLIGNMATDLSKRLENVSEFVKPLVEEPVLNTPSKMARREIDELIEKDLELNLPKNQAYSPSQIPAEIMIPSGLSGEKKLKIFTEKPLIYQREQPIVSLEGNIFQFYNEFTIKKRDIPVSDMKIAAKMVLETDHSNSLLCMAFLSNNIIALGSKDLCISVWDLSIKKKIWLLQGHASSICSLCPVGPNILASGSDYGDCSIFIWEIQSGAARHKLNGHGAAVVSIVALEDKKTIISGSYDKTVKVWDIDKGINIYSINGHNGSITLLYLTSNQNNLLSASLDNQLKIWKLDYNNLNFNGLSLYKTTALTTNVTAMYSGKDNKIFFTGHKDGTIMLWNVNEWNFQKILKISSNPIIELLGIEGMDRNETGLLIFSTRDGAPYYLNCQNWIHMMVNANKQMNFEYGIGIQSKAQYILLQGQVCLATINQSPIEKSLIIWEI